MLFPGKIAAPAGGAAYPGPPALGRRTRHQMPLKFKIVYVYN